MKVALGRSLSAQAGSQGTGCTRGESGSVRMRTELGERAQERSNVLVLIDFCRYMNDRAETEVTWERHRHMNEGSVPLVTWKRHVQGQHLRTGFQSELVVDSETLFDSFCQPPPLVE